MGPRARVRSARGATPRPRARRRRIIWRNANRFLVYFKSVHNIETLFHILARGKAYFPAPLSTAEMCIGIGHFARPTHNIFQLGPAIKCIFKFWTKLIFCLKYALEESGCQFGQNQNSTYVNSFFCFGVRYAYLIKAGFLGNFCLFFFVEN